MRFDHVIYAATDLDAAGRRVEAALGVAVAGGGEHEGLGTHNRILPLGHGYVEVMGLVDPSAPPVSPVAAALARRLASDGDGLFAWAVVVEDVEAVAQRLGTPLIDVVRAGFRARVTGMAEAMTTPALPFFITRDDGVPDPGEGGPFTSLDRLDLAADAARLEDWLGGPVPPYVAVTPGEGVRALVAGGRELR